jgi:dolichyl-phosphate-mannose-protein mannosyltransferase
VSKKLSVICFLMLLIIQFVFPLNCFAQGENLVINPDFEDDSLANVWIADCWDKTEGVTQFSLETSQASSGQKSALIINNSANDSRYKQTINVKPNTYYRMSCWIKTENVGTEQKGANISIENSTDTSKDLKGTNNYWEYIELYGKTSPNQESFTLTVGIGGYGSTNTGKAWFDNIEVVELDSLPPGKTSINMDPNWNPNSQQNQAGNNTPNPFLIGFFVIMAGIIFSVIFVMFKYKTPKPKAKVKSKVTESDLPARSQETKLSFDKKDFIIMASMSLIYLLVALINLGDLKVPTTSWLPAKYGESFVVDLGKETTLSRIYFHLGLGKNIDCKGKYLIDYLDGENGYKHLASFDKEEIFVWKYIDTAPVKTRKLKFTVDIPGRTLNEIGIFESGSTTPLQGITITEKNVSEESTGSVENLFDEQNLVVFKPSYKNSMYFDEVYHARTAFEHIHKIEPYEITHPPLGKLILSIGILLFGMVPFGWRIMGTLFGVLMIPAMYAFGKKFFRNRFYAFSTAFLMMFDFMHFSQTRIATIDSYVTFFIILMYYFMYDYFANKSYVLGFKSSLKPLFLSGLFFGLGAASKWIAFYGAAGLALLFFVTKISEYNDYKKLIKKNPPKGSWVHSFYPLYVNYTLIFCVLAFVLMPLVIYIMSYIPWMMVPGENHGLNLFFTNAQYMLNYHGNLVDTHPYQSTWWEWPIMAKPMAFYFGSDLNPGMASKIFTMGNPAIWWTGILVFVILTIFALSKVKKYFVPIFTSALFAIAFIFVPSSFVSSIKVWSLESWFMLICAAVLILLLILLKFDKKQRISSAVSYIGFIVTILLFKGVERNLDFYKQASTRIAILIFLGICISILFRGIYKYDRKLLVIMAGMVFQFVPWILITRIAFIYHYFSITPFLMLSIVYIIKIFVDKYPKGKVIAYVYLGLVLALFILYYPGLSGLEVPVQYMGYLKWFSTWYF